MQQYTYFFALNFSSLYHLTLELVKQTLKAIRDIKSKG